MKTTEKGISRFYLLSIVLTQYYLPFPQSVLFLQKLLVLIISATTLLLLV